MRLVGRFKVKQFRHRISAGIRLAQSVVARYGCYKAQSVRGRHREEGEQKEIGR